MAILPIRIVPDPVLREKAKKVPQLDGSIQKLIDDMIDTMRDAPGVGLAAPQVGVSLRLVVIETPEMDTPLALINPEVVKASGERLVEEGCLSIPGYKAEITRHVQVYVKARSRDGREIRVKASDDLLAQALEHEIDHINGILYTDYLDSPDKLKRLEPAGQPDLE
ncbi:MAG TPA: peptide deformylase [Dehalococcoidia bacterium]|nr:peptide deformylase [Dehalococcoidia bacterium]